MPVVKPAPDDSGESSGNNAEAWNNKSIKTRVLNPVLQLLETAFDQCENWNRQYDLAMSYSDTLVLPPGLTSSDTYKEAVMRAADAGIVIQFMDGEAKCRARVRTATGYDVACDLNEYKNGGLGCSSGDTKVLGHACAIALI